MQVRAPKADLPVIVASVVVSCCTGLVGLLLWINVLKADLPVQPQYLAFDRRRPSRFQTEKICPNGRETRTQA